MPIIREHRRRNGHPAQPFSQWHPEGPCCCLTPREMGVRNGDLVSLSDEYRVREVDEATAVVIDSLDISHD